MSVNTFVPSNCSLHESFFFHHARALLSAVRGLLELRCGGSILLMRKGEGDVRPINRIHVGIRERCSFTLMNAATQLHRDATQRSDTGSDTLICSQDGADETRSRGDVKGRSLRPTNLTLNCTWLGRPWSPFDRPRVDCRDASPQGGCKS